MELFGTKVNFKTRLEQAAKKHAKRIPALAMDLMNHAEGSTCDLDEFESAVVQVLAFRLIAESFMANMREAQQERKNG